jgi:uncharacterized protein
VVVAGPVVGLAAAAGVDDVAAVATSSITPDLAQITNLGVGIGYRRQLRGELFLNRDRVDFLEIIADHFFELSREQDRQLSILAEHFTLIPHALSLSLGSADGVDPDYLQRLAGVVNRVKPPYWSEHIAFTRAAGRAIGHLCPLPFNREAIDVIERNVAQCRRLIEAPLVLENISYTVALPWAEMTEVQFVSEVVERTDSGLLLDVMNLHANSVNHRYDPIAFLDGVPMERVVQLHLAGGYWRDDVLVDSHSQPTPPEVWSLTTEVLSRASPKGIIIERDSNLPPFEELLGELDHARSIRERCAA